MHQHWSWAWRRPPIWKKHGAERGDIILKYLKDRYLNFTADGYKWIPTRNSGWVTMRKIMNNFTRSGIPTLRFRWNMKKQSLAAILNSESTSSQRRATIQSVGFIVDRCDSPSVQEVISGSSVAKGKRRARPKCTTLGCTKTAKSRGKCNSHGGGKTCSTLDCKNYAVSYGKCITHGVSILSSPSAA